jgi:hypothetical protein
MKYPSLLLAILPWLPFPAAAGLSDQPADADDPAFVREAALEIDKHVARWYRDQGWTVPEVADDATFLRRAFLVTIGRIPTTEEAIAFLEFEAEGKRSRLIDYLLDSPGYSSHMANWAFDLLRVADRKAGSRGDFEPYRAWVRRAIEENRPWDELTRELLAARGSMWDPQEAAVGYYLRDRGMELDNLANSMRIFLGSRMECAQCHDDPFGDTERMDFYELAAFTHGQSTGNRRPLRGIWEEVREEDQRGTVEYAAARLLWDEVFGMTLTGGGRGRIPLPSDWQYRGQPGEMVGGRTPFGKVVRLSDRRDDGEGRSELAEWVTTRNEARFPSVIANRMWQRVMGRGIYEPVDEYVEAAETHLPAMMHELIDLMIDLDYDLKAFQKILLNTRTFQFMPNPEPSKVAGGDDFHGRRLARLSAEQIWDSLITLAGGNPDTQPPRQPDSRIRVRGRPVNFEGKTMKELSDEVLATESEREMRRYFERLVEAVKHGGDGGTSGGMAMMEADDGRGGKRVWVRASELPSPAPPDHLLFLFGQADREIIESASREPNVGQVLALMNGFVQDELVNRPEALVYRSLKGASTASEKIRRLYVTILTRPPSDEEMGWMLEEVEASGEAAYRNIVSALIMSSEFLFLQ